MSNPISYAQWVAQQPDQSAINPQDYLASIGGNHNVNPGSLDDYTQANNLDGSNYAGNVQAYNDALAQYKSSQDVLSSITPQKGQNYTAEQIAQMTGSPVNNFNSYKGVPVATSYNPFSSSDAQGWEQQNQFIQNPDGTYKVANLGGINPDVRVHAPKGSDWTDYMDAAITAAVIAGNAYAGAGALGAAFAPAEGATLAGPTYAEMGYTGLPEGAAGPTYGEMGYTGLNQGEAIASADAASNATQIRDALNTANNAKKTYNLGNTLSNLLSGGSKTASSSIGGQSSSGLDLAKIASLLSPVSTNISANQIKMNQTPFLFESPGQTVSTNGIYDVSGSNIAKANALRNLKV